jgi:hypothetical protein
MDTPNRVDPLAFTLTTRRQTPKHEFGQVLADTLTEAVKTGGAIVGALPGVPVISAAVSTVTQVAHRAGPHRGAVAGQAAANGVVMLGAGAAAGPSGVVTLEGPAAGASGGSSPDQQAFQNDTVREMAAMSDYYMKLQNEMQRESREFNAISNIIKVRHDSAKAAINNIR